MWCRSLCTAAAAVLLAACARPDTARNEITVFAAASLTDAAQELATVFEAIYPNQRMVLNVGASSWLARQIAEGAPADVFLSANVTWMDHLTERGRTAGQARPLVSNRLVIAGLRTMPPLDDPHAILRFRSIAVADPSHVPAGMYAKEALTCAGLWEEVGAKVIPMLDVRTALLAVTSQAAEVALVYASDILATPKVRVLLEWPQACTPPIRYVAARVAHSPNPVGAKHFLEFATNPAQIPVWQRHGFLAPEPIHTP